MLQLSYAGQGTPIAKRWLYLAALGCGLAPLAAGVGALLLYALTRKPLFGLTGLVLVPFELVAVLFGFTFLRQYKRRATQTAPSGEPLLRRQFRIARVVLLANLPTAAVCAIAGMASVLAAHVVVTVHNISPVPVEVELNTPSGIQRIGHLPPGATATRSFSTSEGGRLSYLVVQNGRTLEGTIVEGDADAFGGGAFDVLVKDGTVEWN